MTPINSSASTIEEIGRSSRRAAIVSLLGFLLVMAAIGYAMLELKELGQQQVVAQEQVAKLKEQSEQYSNELSKVRMQLANARSSLSAARAAISAFHAGHLEDAISLYDEALTADPSNAYLQNLRAYSLFRLKKLDAAIEGQRQSVAIDPNYAWGYFDLARFLCAASPPQLEEARRAAAKAISLRPDMRVIMKNDGEFQRVCQHALP